MEGAEGFVFCPPEFVFNTLVDGRTHTHQCKAALLNQPCDQCGDCLRSSSTGSTRTNGWADPAPAAPTQPPTAHHPLPLGRRPNNEKIYDHPRSLLAPFPWETTRSSCTDLQECPKAREPLLVGNSSSLLHRISKYKASGDTVQNTGDQRTPSPQ